MKWQLRLIIVVCMVSVWGVGLMAQDAASCPEVPAPRLVVGQQGRVVPGDANNVRDLPSRDGAKIGEIPGEASFTVLEGPVCADGFNWWRVNYDGLDGWTVEGQGTDYWVEPYDPNLPTNTPPPPTPLPSPTPTLAPARVFEPPSPVVNILEAGVQARVINDDFNS
ncbi:MAG: SH3 domain-containing protein, partial [Armatimonadetes bacterium]|nr:SH3 domain-containing protein [Anaerolineae bacterium]